MNMEILGDYKSFVNRAEGLLWKSGVSVSTEIVQCDTLCYRVETNDRYDEVKRELAKAATLLDESEVNGRLISVLYLDAPLAAGKWMVPYIELPQPKPNNRHKEGLEHAQFVTMAPLSVFQGRVLARNPHIEFDESGMANRLNPLLELSGDDVTVKFHDKHMGAVVELERAAKKQAHMADPITGGHITL